VRRNASPFASSALSAPSGAARGAPPLAASGRIWFGVFHVGINSAQDPAAINPQRERLDNREKTSGCFGQPPCI
jgi:hypothetical protein